MALTSTEKSRLLRARRKALGKNELRNIWVTPEEKAVIKPIITEKLRELREKEKK